MLCELCAYCVSFLSFRRRLSFCYVDAVFFERYNYFGSACRLGFIHDVAGSLTEIQCAYSSGTEAECGMTFTQNQHK